VLGEASPARSGAQASTWDGSDVRAGNRKSGSASVWRHCSALVIKLTSSRAGRDLQINATVSSFEPMRPVIQL
jgi:hypothetical protein